MKRAVSTFILTTIILNSFAQSTSIFADSIRIKNNIPEIAFAIVSVDSILELQTLGFHQVDLKNDQTQAKLTDYFHLGSNTKAITGFIAANLVEDNKIKWTTKFFDLFPEWKKSSNPGYYEITLADLLSHRAKIQPYTSGLEFEELPDFNGDKSEQRRAFAKYLLAEKPVKDTKKNYNYSNAGYSIAALMLEKVSGKSWELLTESIMAAKVRVKIHFGWPNKHNIDQPYGHSMENDTLKALPPDNDYNLNLGEPAGDISMTLPDYAKFIRLNLLGLSGKDSVLKAGTYLFLHSGIKDYSIGWANYTKDNRRFSEHAGSAGTFFCYTVLDWDRKLAYIIVANSATEQAQQGVFTLLERIRERYER